MQPNGSTDTWVSHVLSQRSIEEPVWSSSRTWLSLSNNKISVSSINDILIATRDIFMAFPSTKGGFHKNADFHKGVL